MALKIVSKGEKVQRYSYMLRCMTRAMERAVIFIVMMDWYHGRATVERGEVIYRQDWPDMSFIYTTRRHSFMLLNQNRSLLNIERTKE
jgi:hypothetical protein